MNLHAALLLAASLGAPIASRAAFVLPASCATVTRAPDLRTSIRELRKQVENDAESSFAILCTTIPRIEARYGEQSAEMGWWTASLATPLIAYMDKFDEALPVLQFAQPILERHYGRYGEPLGDIHVAYAWIYFRQGRLIDSAAAWSEALKVRERTPGKKQVELQKVLVGLAQVQLSQRQFDSAERNLQRAHAILVENHETVSEAGAAIESARTSVDLRQERYAAARLHAEETLRIEQQLHDGAAQLVPSYALLGRVFERLDEYEKAEQSIRRAEDLSEGLQGPLQRHHFSTLYQLAALLDERNRAAEAREVASRALAIGEATLGANAPRLVPVLQVLGDAERQLGQLPEAMRVFERAGAIVATDRSNLESTWIVDYYRDLGALETNLGALSEAQATLAAGLKAAGDDPNLAIERARLLLEQTRATGNQGPESLAELDQAAQLLRTKLPESHPAILRVLNQICELELKTPTAAPRCADTAARLDQAPDAAPELRATIFVNQSRLAGARQDSDLARAYAVRAVAAAESAGTPEPLWQAYFQLASVLRSRNEAPLAVFFGKESLSQIERERSHFVGDDRRFEIGFLRDKVSAYRAVADWLLELGRIDEGLAVLHLMKTEELSDFGVRDAVVAGDRASLLTPAESALKGRYSKAVQADSASVDELSRLTGLNDAGKISPKEREQLNALLAGKGEAEIARAARIQQLLRSDIGSAADDPSSGQSIAAPALTRAARGFGADTAFAVFLLTEHHLRILMTARGEQSQFSIPVESMQLKRDIGHFLDEIAQRHDSHALSESLYETIARRVDDFATQHHVHRLTLWLDGPLRYIPVAALWDGHRYLLDKYVIEMYSPALMSADDVTPARPTPWQVRGLGVTKAVATFPALPSVADELCYVVHGPIEGLNSESAACAAPALGNGALVGAGFADTAFTEQRFKDLLAGPKDFSVLHIGTHFRLRPGNAMRSFLLLGDGSKLTLDEMGGFDFRSIELVTLSACETAMGGARTDDGREIEGLSALVQRRGARRVIASLWQVEDESTAQLMRTLYRSFSASHGDAAMALQQAQRAVRKLSGVGHADYAELYYWAGFILSGDRP